MQKNHEDDYYSQERQTEPALAYATTPSILYQTLYTTWPKQLEDDDLELLDISLYHLFYNLNLLLQEILPQLAEISAWAEATPQHLRHQQRQRHQIWLWLNEMKHRLERIEPLCQIITITITHLLTTVDTGTLDLLQKSYQQRIFCQDQQTEQTHRVLNPQEHAYYEKCLNTWQEMNLSTQKLQAFKHLFLPESYGTLTQIDIALTQLYQHAQAIFFSILHQRDSNSSVLLLLLLDLQQHADLLQMQIDMLLTPLYNLRKQAALLVELR